MWKFYNDEHDNHQVPALRSSQLKKSMRTNGNESKISYLDPWLFKPLFNSLDTYRHDVFFSDNKIKMWKHVNTEIDRTTIYYAFFLSVRLCMRFKGFYGLTFQWIPWPACRSTCDGTWCRHQPAASIESTPQVRWQKVGQP